MISWGSVLIVNSTSIFFRQKLSCKTVIVQLPLCVLSCDVSSGLPSVCIWIQNFCSFITLTGYLNSESTNPIILGLSLLPILWHFFNSTILTTDSHFIRNANMPEKQRVCLAYSGGLDTSVSNVVYLCFIQGLGTALLILHWFEPELFFSAEQSPGNNSLNQAFRKRPMIHCILNPAVQTLAVQDSSVAARSNRCFGLECLSLP